MPSHRRILSAALSVFASCTAGGQGTATFTTWGEEYIEQQIPADPSGQEGFIDGWTVEFDKFLVAFHGISVASSDGEVAATESGSLLVDNVVPGRKDLLSFDELEARSWDRVSYQIKPALPDSALIAASPADLELMVANGYSLYVAGTATKLGPDGQLLVKTFHWGFTTATQYDHCQQSPESGQPRLGIEVTNGGTDSSELTTHGDHFFYDRLMVSDDPAIQTVLRFDEKAAADTNADGEITLEELTQRPLDLSKYDPSGLDAFTLGAFVTQLARTVGHFRGEGECRVSALR